MNDETLEQISAVVDDELADGSRFVLHALATNEAYKSAWGRYHLIGECLRGHLPAHVDLQLARRIGKALQEEPVIRVQLRTSRLMQPITGLAIAATVAVAAILGVRQIGSGPAITVTPPVAYNSPGFDSDDNYTVTAVTTGPTSPVPVQGYNIPDDAQQSRLHRYLVNYNEYRSSSDVQGTMPYVRIVAHEVVE